MLRYTNKFVSVKYYRINSVEHFSSVLKSVALLEVQRIIECVHVYVYVYIYIYLYIFALKSL